MALKIITFGKITEITGKEFTLQADDTNELRSAVEKHYPALHGKEYAIAINKKIINGNTKLNGNEEVALMPPYSGG